MEEKIKFTKRLSVKISAIMILAMLVLFGVMIVLILHTSEGIIQDSTNNMASKIVQGHAKDFKNWIDIYVHDLRVYSDAEINQTGSKEQVVNWLVNNKKLKKNDYDYMFFCDMEGTSYHDDGKVGVKGDLVNRDYYQAVIKKNIPVFIGKMIKSKVTNKYVLPVARAAKDANGKTFGMYVGMLGFETVSQQLSQETVGKTGFFFLLDGDGTIIAHKNPKIFMANIKGSGLIEDLMNNPKDSDGVMTDLNGVVTHLYSAHVPMSSWTVIFSMEEKESLKAVNAIKAIIVLFAVIIEIAILVIFLICSNYIFKKIGIVNHLINKLSTGDADLTIQLPVKRDDEIEALVKAVNKFIAKFRSIMITIKNSEVELKKVGQILTGEIGTSTSAIDQMAGNVNVVDGQVQHQAENLDNSAAAVTEITKNIESLDAMIQSQASSVTEASAAIEQMLRNITSVDDSVLKMSEEFKVLEDDTNNGIEQNTTANEMIQKIAEQSSSMADANTIIQNISSQTNLLAMNAAIEAAHAGEAGKGFSVVADEIRKLAETSAQQSAKIQQDLNTIQESISKVVVVSANSEQSFQAVSNRIETTGQLIHHIKSAMEEQQVGSQQILEALQLMNNSTSEVRCAAEEMTEGGTMVMKDINELKDSMDEISGAVSEINNGSGYIKDSTNNIKNISDSLADSIQKISNDVSLFKV